MLTSLTLDDFKSFRHAELELSRLTLLVGANASGKSNVFDALRFLQGLALGMSLDHILNGRWEGGRELWPGIRGGANEVGRGRKKAMRELGSAWPGVLQVCPELHELSDQIGAWASTRSASKPIR